MLRVVLKDFDADVPLKTGDIVDVSGWRNRKALEKQGYIEPTDAKAPTVTAESKRETKPSNGASASSAKPSAQRLRRSPLTSRPRVFETRLAKQGD